MKLFLVAAAVAVSLVSALPAHAVASVSTVYNAADNFDGATNANPNFRFGSYQAGAFTAFPTGGMCLFTTTICLTSGNYLGAYKSGDGFSHNDGTVNVSATDLILHPGQAGEGSAVLFTATIAGFYDLDFTAYQSDDLPVSQTIDRIDGATLTNLATLTTLAPSFGFAERVYLSAGQSIGYSVGHNGDYSFDATGITFTAARVPEPASWALMIAGLGLTGAAMRRRRTAAVAA